MQVLKQMDSRYTFLKTNTYSRISLIVVLLHVLWLIHWAVAIHEPLVNLHITPGLPRTSTRPSGSG